MKYLISCFLLVLFISCSSSDGDNDTTPPPNNTLASVSVVSATNISENSATSGGNVTNDGGANVTAKGICWSTSTNPTIDDNKTSNGSGIGTYISEITGLTANTQYYVRAYATNSEGTSYSNQISFTTEEEPVQCGNVLGTGIELKTQTDVENLGSQGISIINGNLTFDGLSGANSDPITDLSSLSCLQEVNGYILFEYLDSVETLDGFENLQHTDGLVFQTTNIESLEALSNLEDIDGNFIFSRNNSLTNLSGLNNVTSISGTAQIISNDEITSIEGLENLQSVADELWIYDNPKLPNIEGLNNLTQIGGRLYITDNDALTNIDAFASLETLSTIILENNPLLESISVFSNLTISTLEWLKIIQNDALINLDGLEGITTVTDILQVNYNDILEDLDELSNLTGAINTIDIRGNDSLKNINSLINITECQYDLNIYDNPSLENVSGLNGLVSVGQILFQASTLISELDFGGLTSVSFNLSISGESLLNVDSLSNLESIGQTLSIIVGDSFTNLDGLVNLTSVGGDLIIRSPSGALTDVCGLQPLFIANGLVGDYDVLIEDFYVTEQDIIDGNCSQ